MDSDSEVILRALSVKEHAIDVPVVVQLHRKRSGQYLKEASIDVIVPMDEIRMARLFPRLSMSLRVYINIETIAVDFGSKLHGSWL